MVSKRGEKTKIHERVSNRLESVSVAAGCDANNHGLGLRDRSLVSWSDGDGSDD